MSRTAFLVGDNCGQLKSVSFDMQSILDSGGILNGQDTSLVPNTNTILTPSQYLESASNAAVSIKKISTLQGDASLVI